MERISSGFVVLEVKVGGYRREWPPSLQGLE